MPHSRFAPRALFVVGLATVATTAQAQTTLVEEGDMIGTIGQLTRIDDVVINNNADWILRVDTDAGSAEDEVILHNGNIVFQQGSTMGISAPMGATYNFLDRAALTDAGDTMYLFNAALSAGGTTQLLYWNGNLLLEGGVTPVAGAGIPMGSVWDSISEAWPNDMNQIMVGGRIAGLDTLVVLTLDAMGAITSTDVLAIDGTTLPGHPVPIQGFSFTRTRNALNNSGTPLWFVDDDHTVAGGSTTNDSWVYRGTTPLWREGDTMPSHPGSVYGSLSSVELDLNDNGDYVYQGGRDGSFSLDVVVVNDTTIIAEEGMPPPGIAPGFLLTSIGSTSSVYITDNMDVLWYGDWDDPNTDVDTALFMNQSVLIQEGVSTINGNIIDTIAATDKGFDLSDNGRYLLVEVFSITTADPTFNGAYIYDLNPIVGTNYCGPAVVNSSGNSGTIRATGSPAVANNDITLHADNLATNAFGFFITSQTQGFAMMAGGSSGNICLAGTVGRAVGGLILNSGSAGELSVAADLTMLPQPVGTANVMAGETWNFQCWFRDAVGGMTTSNFTDAVSITFN